MGFLGNILLLVSSLSLHTMALTVGNVSERDTTQFLTPPSHKARESNLAQGNAMFGLENTDFLSQLVSWPSSSSEDMDRQGVLGEYSEESTETYPDRGSTTREDTTLREIDQTTQSSLGNQPQKLNDWQTFNFPSSEKINVSDLNQSTENEPAITTLPNEIIESQLPFLLHGSIPSPLESAGSGGKSGQHSPSAVSNNWERTKGSPASTRGKPNVSDDGTDQRHTKTTTDDSRKSSLNFSKTSGTSLSGSNTDMSTTTCKTSDQTWTPTYSDDFTPSEPLSPSLTLNPALLVPLYSDWNSAFATWGFAWEAHIYGLGAIFTLFGLNSGICLLGLPIRCPPGFQYFTMLHFFILGFAGIQAFTLVYDAYSSQDRLPLLVTQLISELPLPCLISTFSFAFLLLSLHTRSHLSLPHAISTSCSALPKPYILLFMCLLYFMLSLGCFGLLQLFQGLPTVILLFPHVIFVFLTIFLSFSYLIFYCLRLVNNKHIYRLNDSGETGGSPEVTRLTRCPFSKVEDWERVAGAGLGSSLCLLGCGGLQLYGILHALGFGGVDGYGFQPWPWWGYQIGCRFCEAGVCLGLSIIGTYPIFCSNNSPIKTLTNPRPGSWSRLSYSSPLRELNVPSQDEPHSPVLSSHETWSQSKEEKLVVCEDVTKRQSEVLPLCSLVEPPANGINVDHKLGEKQSTIPTLTPNPPQKSKTMDVSQQSLNSVGADSTGDFRPPSPIDLSRSIDQALFNESLFSHSIFGPQRLFQGSSSVSLSSPKATVIEGPSSVGDSLFRTSSCGKVDQEKCMSNFRASKPYGSLASHSNPPMPPEQHDWKGSVSGSTQGLCTLPKETGKLRSNSWTNRGQNFSQSNFPRGIPHLSYHRRYRTLSLASKDRQGSSRLAGTKHLSESKQLEWDTAVQAEFVHVCKQIDALSVCSDTIDL
uniref:Proline-rich transmembrane protein 4 n=1 Tax=Nothobranchius korthausae TaxID=1143690 RepID=A0A1A8F1C8_9TELE